MLMPRHYATADMPCHFLLRRRLMPLLSCRLPLSLDARRAFRCRLYVFAVDYVMSYFHAFFDFFHARHARRLLRCCHMMLDYRRSYAAAYTYRFTPYDAAAAAHAAGARRHEVDRCF